jgi:cytochrome c oxidase subunit 2
MQSKRRLQDWHHLLAMCLTIVVLAGGLIYLFLHVDFIPHPFSTEREYIDGFVKILFSIAGVFFSIVIVVLAYSLIFFRRRPGDTTDGPPIRGNSPLEQAWTIIPLVIVIGLAVFGGVILDKMTAAGPPQTEMEVDVLAFRFGWQFTYPEYNVTAYELYVPVNQRILVKLQSKDVVHSFWVQQWGPKQDAVPGITTQVRYTPTQIGQYTVQCSQLCGYGHSYMTASVFVTSSGDFQNWIQQQQKATPVPSPSPAATPAPTASPSTSAIPVALSLTAHNIAFDKSSITVPAGAQVTINFTNNDNAVLHNFSVYTDSSATQSIFTGKFITGPATIAYIFTAPTAPGNYFFRCDVHPTIMTGTFIVK